MDLIMKYLKYLRILFPAEALHTKITLIFMAVGVIIVLSSVSNKLPPATSEKSPIKVKNKMTSQQHLEKAKEALSDGYKPGESFGRVEDAKSHLFEIKEGGPEWAERGKLLAEVTRREMAIKKIAEKTVAEEAARTRKELIEKSVNDRKQFADLYENSLLEKGMDAHVSTQGKNHTTLRIQWVLIGRPFVHNFANDTSNISLLRSLGFSKVILADGYNSSWTVDVR